MLQEDTLFGSIDKVQIAIERIQAFEPPEGYYLAFSGGKDSLVIKQLAIEAGVNFESHYNMTTIDPPDLIYYMRVFHPEVIFEKPKEPFLKALVRLGFPQRQRRWCCRLYKENHGNGRILTGIRWEESRYRQKRQMVEPCIKGKGKHYVHPIIDWTEEEVWEFIKNRELPYCKLYDEGWKRIGCLFCPMAYYKQRIKHVLRYPAYARAFKIAFNKLHKNRKSKGLTSVDRWKDGDEMFDWWINDKRTEKENINQVTFFDN